MKDIRRRITKSPGKHLLSPKEIANIKQFERRIRAKDCEVLVHQVTTHGLTTPIAFHHGLLALPNPAPSANESKAVEFPERPGNRRWSMLGVAHLMQPGDYVFVFQADPQEPARTDRGLIGIFEVDRPAGQAPPGTPPLLHPIHGNDYRLHTECPTCANQFVHQIWTGCPAGHNPSSGLDLRKWNVNDSWRLAKRGPLREHIMSLLVPVRTVVRFDVAIPDETAYGTLDAGRLIWTGRHDNGQGRGKGNSVRQILPEEALRLLALLLRQRQQATNPARRPSSLCLTSVEAKGRLGTLSGSSALFHDYHGRNGKKHELAFGEGALHAAAALQARDSESSLRVSIERILPPTKNERSLEFAASEYPAGYTASEVDFLIAFREFRRVRRVVALEFKHSAEAARQPSSVVQAWNYAPSIGQAMSQASSYDKQVLAVRIHPVLVTPELDRPIRFAPGATKMRHRPGKSKVTYEIAPLSVISYGPKQPPADPQDNRWLLRPGTKSRRDVYLDDVRFAVPESQPEPVPLEPFLGQPPRGRLFNGLVKQFEDANGRADVSP